MFGNCLSLIPYFIFHIFLYPDDPMNGDWFIFHYKFMPMPNTWIWNGPYHKLKIFKKKFEKKIILKWNAFDWVFFPQNINCREIWFSSTIPSFLPSFIQMCTGFGKENMLRWILSPCTRKQQCPSAILSFALVARSFSAPAWRSSFPSRCNSVEERKKKFG